MNGVQPNERKGERAGMGIGESVVRVREYSAY